jgi:hypothetical protein
MLFWAVVSDSTEEAVELFTRREEAEAIVQAWERDEPGRPECYGSRRSGLRLRPTRARYLADWPSHGALHSRKRGSRSAQDDPSGPLLPCAMADRLVRLATGGSSLLKRTIHIKREHEVGSGNRGKR